MKVILNPTDAPVFNAEVVTVGSFVKVVDIETGRTKHGVISEVSTHEFTYVGINLETGKSLPKQKVTIRMYLGDKYEIHIYGE